MKQPPLGLTKPAEIVAVTDGDTVKVKVTFEIIVRLEGVNAPEIGRAKTPEEKSKGRAWKSALLDEVTDAPTGKFKTAVMHIPFTEKQRFVDITTLGRAVGRLFIDGKDLTDTMNEKGLEK